MKPARLGLALLGAIGLHALILATQRPTLLQSASMAVAPAMTVRLLTDDHQVRPPGRPEPAAVEPAAAPVAATPEAPAAAAITPGPASEKPRVAMPRDAAGARQLAAATSAPSAPARTASVATAAASSTPAAGLAPSKPAAEPELPPAPAYLAGGKLDPGPRPLTDIDPAYPPEANLQEGQVVLRLLINEAGEVDNVAVVRASPKGLFEASALTAFSAAKFSPGKLLGVPVKSQVTIEVQFMPINRGAKVSGRGY